MLKNYGNFFANSLEDMNTIVEALRSIGYDIAYISNISGSIVKEEDEPEE